MTISGFIEKLNGCNMQKEHNDADLATRILKRAQKLNLPLEAISAIEETMTAMNKDTNMKAAFNQIVIHLTDNYDSAKQVIDLWQTVDMDENIKDMIMACSFINSVDYAKEYYIEHQIDEKIFLDTFGDIKIWMIDCKNNSGWWGLKETKWLVNHIHHRLFRLGRLQFMPKKVRLPYLLLNNKKTGCNKWVIKDGINCTSDGYIVQEHTADLNTSFNTCFEKGDDIVVSHEVVDGVIKKDKSCFEIKEWIVALDLEDSMVLDIHIPAGGKLSKQACEESLLAAKSFFQSYMPKAFVCQSWLLDKNLHNILKSNSNILKFQELFCIVPPINMSFSQSLERIFGTDKEIDNVCPKNSLQKGALKYIQSGKVLRQGLGIIRPLISVNT